MDDWHRRFLKILLGTLGRPARACSVVLVCIANPYGNLAFRRCAMC